MIDKADMIFVMICAIFMLSMTPAAGIIYSGSKRTDGITRSWINIGVVTVLWFVIGFSLAYGTDHVGILGGGEHILLKNIDFVPNNAVGTNHPPLGFFILQVAVAVFTATAACSTAMKKLTLKAYILFLCFWNLLVYIPLVHMVWDQGLLFQVGLLDYAGGTVIHISAGFSALAVAIASSKCQAAENTLPKEEFLSICFGMVLLAYLALYGGIGLGINEISVRAVCNAILGAASGIVVWLIFSGIKGQRVDLKVLMMGCFAGLIGVAAGAAYVTPQSGFLIGGIVSFILYFCIQQKNSILMRNTVFVMHGIGGIAGTILTGVFADPAFCTLPQAMGRQLMMQMGCVYAVAMGSFVWTWILLIVIGRIVPLYMPEDPEYEIEQRIFAARKNAFGGTKTIEESK